MNMTDQLNALAGNASCITLAVHTHPDGDAVGSGTGMLSYLLECKGADAVLVFPDRVQDSLSFMLSGIDPGRLMTFGDGNPQAAGRIARSDLLVCLDCSSFSRTAGLESLLRESGAKKVLIDHHLDPERDAFDLVFSESETSSASELLYSILLRMPEIAGDPSRLPPLCASALMTGMTTDTNNFSNSVFPSTLKMASELIAAGVDRDSILESLYSSYRENRLRLLGCLLGEKMQITPEGVAFIVLDSRTQERFGMVQGETEGFVNMPLSIGKVRMSIFLTQQEDHYRVSIRSKKGTSANLCARQFFHGGGHEQAAGGKLFFPGDIPSPEDAQAYILKVTERFFRQ